MHVRKPFLLLSLLTEFKCFGMLALCQSSINRRFEGSLWFHLQSRAIQIRSDYRTYFTYGNELLL